MYQKILFNPEEIFKEPLKKYEMFFSLLNLSYLEPENIWDENQLVELPLPGHLSSKICDLCLL